MSYRIVKCKVCPSEADYITRACRLIRQAVCFQDELIKNKILIAHVSFHNMPSDCYRIAVKKHFDNEILINNIRRVIEV